MNALNFILKEFGLENFIVIIAFLSILIIFFYKYFQIKE